MLTYDQLDRNTKSMYSGMDLWNSEIASAVSCSDIDNADNRLIDRLAQCIAMIGDDHHAIGVAQGILTAIGADDMWPRVCARVHDHLYG